MAKSAGFFAKTTVQACWRKLTCIGKLSAGDHTKHAEFTYC
ncbi:hypothetical protein [Snodgrassella alvi]